MSSATIKCYFCASAASICDVMQRGVWYDTPPNCLGDPLTLTRGNGAVVSPTKMEKYVRLSTDPSLYLEDCPNPAALFFVEVDPTILRRTDTLRAKYIEGGPTYYLKNTMVDPGSIQRVVVSSEEVVERLRSLILPTNRKIPVVANTALFPSDFSLTTEFAITPPKYPPAPPPIPPDPPFLHICQGDLLRSAMQTHVNTVNCVGVMGKGIALAFRNQYPGMFTDYVTRCKKGRVKLGFPYPYPLANGRIIVNFPTKDHWKENSDIARVEEGLKHLVAKAKTWGITSIAIPPLGCSNGKLDWKDVGPLIYRHAEQLLALGISVEIYAPHEVELPSTGKRKREA